MRSLARSSKRSFLSWCPRASRGAQGWDNEALEIAEQWIFRFPKRADSARDMERELRLLPALIERLPLAVPRYQFFGRATAEFPYLFAGYRKLPGTPATQLTDINEAVVAAQLGEFLAKLHAISSHQIEAWGVEAADEDPRNDLTDAMAEIAAVAPQMPTGIIAACRDFLRHQLPAFEFDKPRCLRHDDLRDEHILLAPDGSRVCGIIDWTDASEGDAALDFAGLWAWRGEAFVQLVLEGYRHPIDANFWQRLRFYGMCCITSTLHYALETGDQRSFAFQQSALLRALGENANLPDVGSPAPVSKTIGND